MNCADIIMDELTNVRDFVRAEKNSKHPVIYQNVE